MRVLIATPLFPPEVGGPATFSKALAEAFPKQGIEVDVVPFSAVRMFPKIVRHLLYFFKILWRGRFADIIFAQDPVSVGLPSMMAARMLRKRFVVKIVGDYAWEQGVQRAGITESLDHFSKQNDVPFFVKIFKKIQTYVAVHAERVIVPSAYLKRIVSYWGVPEGHITVVYNSYAAQSAPGNREVLRSVLQFTGMLIVSAGRLVPWKGFEPLIEIMPRVLKRFPDARLLIAGEGPDREKLEQKIRSRGMEKHITLAGRLDQTVLWQYVKAADLFILNTFYEGLSHQLLEVMDAGTPIVTTSVGGNPELITHNSEGLLVPYGNAKELERAILRLLEDRAFALRLAHKAKEKVTRFSQEQMIRGTLKALKL